MPDAAFTLSGLGAGTTTVSTDGFDAAALIKNTGANPAYASPVPITDAGQGFPIDPGGGTLAWPQGRPLYLLAPAGTTTVVIDPGNGDGTTTSPTELANAIIGAGLAQQIGEQINVQGVPPIDKPALLYTKTGTVAANSSWNLGLDTSAWVDISKYNSLFVHVVANAQAAPNVADSFVFSAVTTSNTAAPLSGFTALTIESVECPLTQELTDGNGSWCQMILPAYGDGLWLSFEPISSMSYAINYTITVTGSYKSVTGSKTYAQNQHFLNAGNMPKLDDPTIPGMDNLMYGFSYTIPASSAAYVGVMTHINTPYDVTWVPETGTAPVGGTDIYISTGQPNRQIIGVYGDKQTTGNINRWEKILNGGRAPHLYINNHDTFAKNYNFVFAFCR